MGNVHTWKLINLEQVTQPCEEVILKCQNLIQEYNQKHPNILSKDMKPIWNVT